MRYIDPTGLWNWDASAGGGDTDAQLEAKEHDKSLTKKERKAAKRARAFRTRFRASLEAAKGAASSAGLNIDQQIQVAESTASYGREQDSNGVIVGVRNDAGGSAAATLLREDDTITVTFNNGLSGDRLTSVLAHEGRHVADAQAFVGDYHTMYGTKDLNHFERETRAWNVGSYVAQALNMKSYGPKGGGREMDAWNRGWKTVDWEKKRAEGITRIMRYSNLNPSDTDRYSNEHKHVSDL